MDILQQGSLYQLDGLKGRTYRGQKYLSIPCDSFTFSKIDDVGDVAHSISKDDHKIYNVNVRGVKSLDSFYACYACKGKVIETTENLGDCSRCSITQRFDRCELRYNARLDLQSEETGLKTVTVFSPLLEAICQGTASKVNLFTCSPFDATISENGIITSIKR